MENESGEFKPPYNAFQTFWGFVGDLAKKPLPPQIDRSVMDGKSGSDQAGLFSALRGFDFIDENNNVLSALQAFVRLDEDGRARVLGDRLASKYPNQLAISAQNGTEKLLLESFTQDFGYTGATCRKAMTFFLHAAKKAGIDVSPHFPIIRSGSGGGTRAKRQVKRRTVTPPAPPGRPASSGNTYTADLGGAGTATLILNVDIFRISSEIREKLLKIVDDLKALGAPESPADQGEDEEVGE